MIEQTSWMQGQTKLRFGGFVRPEHKAIVKDICRGVLCGCKNCKDKAIFDAKRVGLDHLPSKDEAREVLGIVNPKEISPVAASQIERILEKKHVKKEWNKL